MEWENDRLAIKSSAIRFFGIPFRVLLLTLRLVLNIIFKVFNSINKRTLLGSDKTPSVKLKKIKAGKPTRPGILQSITPYRITINRENKVIIFKKRNWYVFGGKDEQFRFVNVRNCTINERIVTSDIHVRVFGGSVNGFWFSKPAARRFRDALLYELEAAGVHSDDSDE